MFANQKPTCKPEAPLQNNGNNIKGNMPQNQLSPYKKNQSITNAHAKQPRGKMNSATTEEIQLLAITTNPNTLHM